MFGKCILESRKNEKQCRGRGGVMGLRKSLAEMKPEWLRRHEEARESRPRAGT